MILRLLFAHIMLLKIVVPADYFCSVLCNPQNCNSYKFDECKGSNCGTSFIKGSGGGQFNCVTQLTTNYLNTMERHQAAGKSSDISFVINSSAPMIPVSTLNVSSSSTGNATANCNKVGDPKDQYEYYGNSYIADNYTISHPGITGGKFYKFRLRYWIITIQKWDNSATLNTKFVQNITETVRTKSLKKDQMQHCKNVCNPSGSSNDQECFGIIDQTFIYNDTTTSLTFELYITGATTNTSWGIKEVLVIARLCHPYCLSCWGDAKTQCWTCDYTGKSAMLSAISKCDLTCSDTYGINSANLPVCILCSANCKSCNNDPYNCTACLSGAYLYNIVTPNVTCVTVCPAHSFLYTYWISFWSSYSICNICNDKCGNCNSFNVCTTCNLTYFFYNSYCYNPCPPQTYNNTALTCGNCNPLCYTCSGSASNCTVCDTNGTTISYLYVNNNTCVQSCGSAYFEDTNLGSGPNLCTLCDTACQLCDINSTYCSRCALGNYLYNFTCGPTCTEVGYFADELTRTCLLCEVYCVGLGTRLYFSDQLKNQLIYEMTFTEDLNWTQTQLINFVTITENDPIVDLAINFIVTYELVSLKKYRIKIQPLGYIFLYNITLTFQTGIMGGTIDRAINARPFKMENYQQISSIKWFLIKAPSLSDPEKMIVNGVSKMSEAILQFTTLPYVQEIKKTGIFAWLLGGAQATSLSCLVNTIPSQNLYEGVRLWASFVFFDVPEWQSDSNRSKYVIVPDVKQVIKNARLLTDHEKFLTRILFDSTSLQWRFNRTGHTSFFIFDVYMNIFLIVFCWSLILIANCCIEHKIKYKQYIGKFYSFTLKVHEFSIFYITLTTLLQWIYFDAASGQRWVSFIMCIFFNIYFFVFELYLYYDMIKYPRAQIGNDTYEYYCLKYGSLLKNIRFQEYDPTEQWSPKHWFRPYNYHIMSYYKKFLMLISLPIFYYTPHAQICVLIFIQVLQIIRYLVVWPFKSKIRNFIRVGLDLILLVFFFTVLYQGFIMVTIMQNDNSLQPAIEIFFKIGWLGFVSCWVFNLGFVIIIIYDTVLGCRKSNRELMDEARKIYYMQKLNAYQQQNSDVPLSLINKWVKLGNLNNRKYDELPDINLRLESYRILKSKKGYEIEMKKLTDLYMNIEFNFQNDNNITAGKKYSKRFTLHKALSPEFYNTVHNLYEKYSNHLQFEYLTIKTFQKIAQCGMKPGQKIILKPEQMSQKIELETYAGQTKTIKLEKIISGFPIDENDLKKII